jgi:nicotinamidase-related amidase
MKALLIIDMQKGCFNPYTSRHDTFGVIDRINTLSEKFRKKQYPVIFIQHDGTREGELFPQTDEWSLLPDLTKKSTDLYVGKTANDSFYKSGLEEKLISLGVDEVYITGSATDYCVDSTVKSALVKDYKVTVVADGHTTRDKKNISAKLLIEHYNEIWADMSPTLEKIRVLSMEEVKV